ncbi:MULTISPECIES: hypothetical protein [Neisseria]|uniref:hypothetical protein n=1 Tax=Neisseria TaxID=482 RepID=UPI0006CE9FC1|nr:MULTISPECIES: hypothetical protein [Neisseria]KPN71839.1 hypothetical protein AKG09_03785 [Neisseria sp. 83E34]
MITYKSTLPALLAACLLAACHNAEQPQSKAVHQAASATEAAFEPQETIKPPKNEPSRDANGLLPACAAYVRQLEACYNRLPKASAAPYRETLTETKEALKEADSQACEMMSQDFKKTVKTLKCG